MTALRPVKMNPHKPLGKAREYRKFWRIVDGAVRDTMLTHPDYFPNRKRLSQVRSSINKRIVGALISFAEQSARGALAALIRERASRNVVRSQVVGSDGVASRCGDTGRGKSHAPAHPFNASARAHLSRQPPEDAGLPSDSEASS